MCINWTVHTVSCQQLISIYLLFIFLTYFSLNYRRCPSISEHYFGEYKSKIQEVNKVSLAVFLSQAPKRVFTNEKRDISLVLED